MNTSDLKIDLIKSISLSNNVKLLKEIKRLLKLEEEIEEIYVFSEEQQKRIDVAMKQYENGEFISNEEAEKDIQKWFEEQEKLHGYPTQ